MPKSRRPKRNLRNRRSPDLDLACCPPSPAAVSAAMALVFLLVILIVGAVLGVGIGAAVGGALPLAFAQPRAKGVAAPSVFGSVLRGALGIVGGGLLEAVTGLSLPAN